MEEIIPFSILIIISILGLVAYKKKKIDSQHNEVEPLNKQELGTVDCLSNDLQIKFEMLPASKVIDDSSLVEIKDSKVLSQINNLVPELFKTGTTASNAIQRNTQNLYQVVLPKGEKLAKSKDIKGAYRAIYHGKKGIKGQANLIKTDNSAKVATNAAASAMGVAAMVVGQYYMTQINSELDKISKDIAQIVDFQNNEYKSRVLSLMAQVKRITSYQSEILENDELRLLEITNLNNLEQQSVELLGQANLTIEKYYKKERLTFKEYEEELSEVQQWYTYQKILLNILCKISDLKHALHLGAVSKEQCCALLVTYSKQVDNSILELKNWHKIQVEKHCIRIDAKNRKRVGLDGILHKIPGTIKKNLKYKPLSEKTAQFITSQLNGYDTNLKKKSVDLYKQEVRLISKKGKIYYLPEDNKIQISTT